MDYKSESRRGELFTPSSVYTFGKSLLKCKMPGGADIPYRSTFLNDIPLLSHKLTDNLPVMVYFHGGGFTIGSGNSLQPQYFMDENVVMVLVNYRLGPFG